MLGALVWGVDNEERQLRSETSALLTSSGFDVTFDVSGRDATIYGTVDSDEAAANLVAAVDAIPGMRLVKDSLSVTEPVAPQIVPPTVSMRIIGDAISIRGSVASPETAEAMLAAAREQYGENRVVDGLEVSENVESQSWVGRIRDVFPQLADLRSGGFVADETSFMLTGEVASASVKERIEQNLDLIFDGVLPIESNLTIAVLPSPTFTAQAADGVVTLGGALPDEETVDRILEATRRLYPGTTIINNMKVAEVAGPNWLEAIGGLLDVATRLEPWDISVADGELVITGLTVDQDRVATIQVLAEEVVGGELAVITDVEVSPEAIASQLTQLLAGTATFDSNSATLSAEGEALLDEAIALLVANPGARLIVEGHTDDQGDEATNLELSQQRAEAVVAYLVAGGVDAARLEAIGYGETRPIADNVTAEGRAQNRRIDFVIEGGDG